MPIKAQDKVLSLLLDVSQCTFGRISEFKNNGHVRHQFGRTEHALLIEERQSEKMSSFVDEDTIEFDGYQFSISIVNSYHVHIEVALSAVNEDVPNNRKAISSLSTNVALITIELVHSDGLPECIYKLNNDLDIPTSTSSNACPLQNKQEWLAFVLLKTICVSIENLQLAKHYTQLTSDSVTKLRSRTALQNNIDEQAMHSGMVLCMVHCTDFQHVNRKFGQAKGDTVLHEIAGIIEQHSRGDDISGRFGGALFGIAINAESIADGISFANKLQTALHNKTYLQNAIRLSFNIGLAFVCHKEEQIDASSRSSLLINRAEQALKAAQNSDKPAIVQWEPNKFRLDEQEFNYVGGIFTPDNVTNYRNMLLLWDISSIIADEHTFERLLKSVIERLAFTFEFAFAGIVSTNTTSLQQDSIGNYSYELQNVTDIVDLEWNAHPHKNLIFSAALLAVENSQHTESQEDKLNSLVIPLGNQSQECFFIMGDTELLELTHDTIMLFVGFARQLGKAFKRSELEDQLNRNLERQNAELAQELLELKTGMQSSALVYRSDKMQKIVEHTQRAAQTDTTVLITGESGTGKEKLIHAIHVLSARNEKPLVIVDCGSIPETLIESELFGYVKGAFTGAQSSNTGKIQSANGGILVLDEIGELPLSMQPKLLRFVQEKQYSPVGGNTLIKVDVKIVAVTNRDLHYEVANGKFRKDLFYRLNVLSLHNPPLRERLEDIALLSQHFLSKFSRQFEMEKKQLSQHTIDKMMQYSWPGNIRELENKLMQASLLTTNNEIYFEDLHLDTQNNSSSLLPQQNQQAIPSNTANVDVYNASSAHSDLNKPVNMPQGQTDSNEVLPKVIAHSNQAQNIDSADDWCVEFSKTVNALLTSLQMHTMMNLSIGTTIEQVLLHMAHKKCHSHAKTALLLQLPVSTARRRLHKPLPKLDMLDTNLSWQSVMQMLEAVVHTQINLEAPLNVIKNIVAQNILQLHSNNMGLAAQLMGVSEPTMYKLRKEVL